MPFDTLQDYLEALDRRGELRRIGVPVDPLLEMTEFADRAVKAGGPALLFEQPVGSSIPVAMNLFGTPDRVAFALGAAPDDIAREVEQWVHVESPRSLGDKVRVLGRLAAAAHFPPKRVRDGVCREVVLQKDFSLEMLPVLHCWPGDAGRFLTLPVVFTKNPATGIQNAGMYRLQVFDATTTGMHWHRHRSAARYHREYARQGRRMEAAVALGGDPAITYAATAPLPEDFDEMLFAGFLRKRPVEMVHCETVDLEVPAGSEIVLEGYVDPVERRREGPFGDHTGYYSEAGDFPVFHVTCITHRRKPVYPATIVGRPPMEDCYLGKATERIFLPLMRLQLPEIVDINLPIEGIFHNLAIVAIRKAYAGHAFKVMHALWGMGQMALTKTLVIVDEEVNVQDLGEVIWRVGNHLAPERDLVVVKGPVDELDHAAPVIGFGSKLGIDATRKWPEEGHTRPWPEEIRMSEDVKERVAKLWQELGL